MKWLTYSFILVASCVIAGCSRQASSPDAYSRPETPTAAAQTNLSLPANEGVHTVSEPVMMPILAAWQEGNKPVAISHFLEADWMARPLFAPNMTIGMSEDQLKTFFDADRQRKMDELAAQIDLVKQVVEAVAQMGSDAASQGNDAQAQKCFASLKQCGTALASPGNLRVVQHLGQILAKIGDNGLIKVRQ